MTLKTVKTSKLRFHSKKYLLNLGEIQEKKIGIRFSTSNKMMEVLSTISVINSMSIITLIKEQRLVE